MTEGTFSQLPKLGLGTYRMTGSRCQAAVERALALGYRHIDTGQMYANEVDVGARLAASGLSRQAYFLTGKVCHALATPDEARAALDETLRGLRTDYLDLCLLHWPRAGLDIPGILDMLARAQQDGKTRLIGVANFPLRLLRMAVEEIGAPIVCNQIEYHVLLDQTPILTMSWTLRLLTPPSSPSASAARSAASLVSCSSNSRRPARTTSLALL